MQEVVEFMKSMPDRFVGAVNMDSPISGHMVMIIMVQYQRYLTECKVRRPITGLIPSRGDKGPLLVGFASEMTMPNSSPGLS